MSSDSHVHVVAKADIGKHEVISLQRPNLQPLQDGHVRVRALLISLTHANLSYAQLGTMLHWWDAYPLPLGLPTPYNDPSQYGVCPTWGYGEILESKVPGIEAETLVWGYWPTHDVPVDLQLVPADVPGHWIESSDHRGKLMNLYQRYIVRNPSLRWIELDRAAIERMAWEVACRSIWEAGYLINAAIFGNPPIHPAGEGTWDEADADLSSAVVISLSAAGKTARAFTDALINRRAAGTGPLAYLAITSIPDNDLLPRATFPTSAVSYDDMTRKETLSWVVSKKPYKIAIVDFGGRGDSLHRLLKALGQNFNVIKTVTIGVGGGSQCRTPEELGQLVQRRAEIPNWVRMNTSPIRDAMIQKVGVKAYFSDLDSAWEGYIKGESVRDLKLVLGTGVQGDDGIEGGWTKLCEGKVSSDVAMAFEIPSPSRQGQKV